MALSENGLFKALSGTWHHHTCADPACRRVYRCTWPLTSDGTTWCEVRDNGLCAACRGLPYEPELDEHPTRPCCIDGMVPVTDREDRKLYRLAGLGPWYRCTTCSRVSGWPRGASDAHTQSYAHTYAQPVDNRPPRLHDLGGPMPTPTKHEPGTFLSGWCTPGNSDRQHAGCCIDLRNGNGELLHCRCNKPGCHNDLAATAAAMSDDELQQDVRDSGAILCGDKPPSRADLEQVSVFAEQLARHGNDRTPNPQHHTVTVEQHHSTATDDGTPVEVTVTGERTAWSADEVADLMVELDVCPLCSASWPDHTFTDDDKVVCP